jgi:hypothetical protein
VDQSITEDNVVFCGHSKRNLGGEYGNLEKELFSSLRAYYEAYGFGFSSSNFKEKLY